MIAESVIALRQEGETRVATNAPYPEIRAIKKHQWQRRTLLSRKARGRALYYLCARGETETATLLGERGFVKQKLCR